MRLRHLAKKAAEGDEEAKDDVALEAPQGFINGMSLDEFVDKMAHDDDFAEEVYAQMSGPKYGSKMEEPGDFSDEDQGGKGKIVRIVKQFEVSPEQVDELMEAISDMIGDTVEDDSAHF